MKTDRFISVVAPLHNDASYIEAYIEETVAILKAQYTNFELVLVDDGSTDNTVAVVSGLLGRLEGIRLLQLSREFGEEVAIAAGLDSVIGDYTVVMLPHMDPPELIPEMVDKCINGSDIVYGVRRTRAQESLLSRWGTALFYWYCHRQLKMDLPENSTQFRCMSRQVVNAILQIKDSYRYLRLFSSYVGYSREPLAYDPVSRAGQFRQRSFGQSLNMAMAIILENSVHPLRFVSWIGLFAVLGNLVYVAYVVAVYFLKDNIMEGWTTLSLQNAGQFCFISVILVALCEYTGRVLNRLQDRPLYYLMAEKNSGVLLIDEERRNVVEESRPTDID